jgi:hypothetical protein
MTEKKKFSVFLVNIQETGKKEGSREFKAFLIEEQCLP